MLAILQNYLATTLHNGDGLDSPLWQCDPKHPR